MLNEFIGSAVLTGRGDATNVQIGAVSGNLFSVLGVRPTLDDMIDHIAYVADLVGIDHVGIGSDFFEAESPVRFEHFFRIRYPEVFGRYTLADVYFEEFNRVDHLPMLTEALLARGFSAGDVAKVLGANFLRVFDKVWKA